MADSNNQDVQAKAGDVQDKSGRGEGGEWRRCFLRAPSTPARVVWSLVCLVASLALVLQCYARVTKYLTYPVQVTVVMATLCALHATLADRFGREA